MDWEGGKYSGNYKKINDKYKARITHNRKTYSKTFNSENNAEHWLIEKSKEFGILKNRYRVSEDQTYLEVELTQGKILLCDIEDIPYVQNYKWFSKKDKDNYYCCGSLNNTKYNFHRLIKPWGKENEWKQVDHINRNGLDNRRKNLRDGSGKINANNCRLREDNTSNKTGVHYSNYDKCWVVQWNENDKRRKKSFRVCDNTGEKKKMNHHKTSRTFEEAKKLAEEFRIKKDKELNLLNGYNVN